MILNQVCILKFFLLVNSLFIESAGQVFEVMEGGKIGLDVVTYHTIVKGYF